MWNSEEGNHEKCKKCHHEKYKHVLGACVIYWCECRHYEGEEMTTGITTRENFETGDPVIAILGDLWVLGSMAENFKNDLSASALAEIYVAEGLPFSKVTVNVNEWDIHHLVIHKIEDAQTTIDKITKIMLNQKKELDKNNG